MGPFSRALVARLTPSSLHSKNFPFFTAKYMDIGKLFFSSTYGFLITCAGRPRCVCSTQGVTKRCRLSWLIAMVLQQPVLPGTCLHSGRSYCSTAACAAWDISAFWTYFSKAAWVASGFFGPSTACATATVDLTVLQQPELLLTYLYSRLRCLDAFIFNCEHMTHRINVFGNLNICYCLLIIVYWFYIFEYWLLTIDHWLLIIDFWFLSTPIDYWLLIIDYLVLGINYLFLSIDYWLLAIDYLLFIIDDFWLLIVDYWLQPVPRTFWRWTWRTLESWVTSSTSPTSSLSTSTTPSWRPAREGQPETRVFVCDLSIFFFGPQISVPDPCRFDRDPDTEIRTTGLGFRIQILLFSAMAFNMPAKIS